jgi:hypothetical protein
MKYMRWLLLLSVLATSHAVDTPWSAEWIGPAVSAGANTWICYRTTITCPSVPKKPVVRIACDSKYWLWINGQLVVFEGQLKRGPTPQDTYFDRVDLTGKLVAGRNSIAVLVWYFGKDGFSHRSSGKAGLVFDADLDGTMVASGVNWKTRIHPAYGDTGNPVTNFRLSESNIRFDARLDLSGWTDRGYDDRDWSSAVSFGRPPCAPWNRLIERPIPLWCDSGLRDYVNAQALPTISDGKPIVCSLPANIHVTPWLEADAPAAATIDIRTDDYQGGGVPNVRAEYVTKAGRQSYESVGWMNGHDVRYTIPAGVKILGLKYRETGYDADEIGRFVCSDQALNGLWTKAKRTLMVTMRDTYMDCPDRERAQWWGDAVNELGEAFYVFDSARGPLLARKGMLELAGWQRDDGALYAPVPGCWDKELPPQMLASVGWYGFRLYHWYTGDDATIAAVYPAVSRYMALWKQDADGQAIHRKGGWEWSDWGQDIDVAVLDSAWLYLALRGAADMAVVAGHSEDVASYEQRMQVLAAGFDRVFWRGDRYHDPRYKGRTDDRANALAVVAGLAKPEHYGAIRRVLREQQQASPYMEKYVLEALCLMGFPEDALARMKQRYAEQIASPLTTLWEGWGLGSKGFGGGTYNHAWSGGPLTILSQYIAGIAPGTVGWSSIRIAPQPGGLDHFTAVAPTPHGPVTVAWQEVGGVKTLRVVAPVGIPTTVVMPITDAGSIRMNGRALPLPDVKRDPVISGAIVVAGGTWTFTGR